MDVLDPWNSTWLKMFRSVSSRGEDVGVVLVSEAPDDRHGREDR